jgi:hypothetical protein
MVVANELGQIGARLFGDVELALVDPMGTDEDDWSGHESLLDA